MNEVPLTGGRVTRGVCRVGDTVRRPPRENSQLVRALLRQLDERGFDGAPRYPLAAQGHGVVCHNDLSPCNFVFRAGTPVAIIDFDAAAPGERLRDVGMALFLWLNLGTDGRSPTEQVRRIDLFCRAYGVEPDDDAIDAILSAVGANVERLRADGRVSAGAWWQKQLDWLKQHRADLAQTLQP